MKSVDLSIIIPLFNEEESLPELCAWIEKVMAENGFSYEVILIDDGSRDKSWQIIESLGNANKKIKGIRFRRNYGKSAALNSGFTEAAGDVVITMDADLQDSPDEIPALYKMIKEEGYDLVSGWKKKRYDPISKRIPSRFFNRVTRSMSGIKNLHDFNCGLKAYKREVVKSIEVYGEMHRYIPVLSKWAGFGRIGEKIVTHYPRKYGKTKFGLERFINGFLDLLSIMFVSKFGKRPMHLFGTLGIIMFVVGFLAAFYLGVAKLWAVYSNTYARLLTDRPSFFISLACMIIGSFMFLAGFLGELIVRSSSGRNQYLIAATSNISGAE